LLTKFNDLVCIESYTEMQTKFPSSTVVIAALNEQEGIGRTIVDFKESLLTSNILVVDGHSSDRTVDIARNLGAEVVFQDGLGKGDAISKALEMVTSKYIVLTDADFTYPAKYVADMIQILENDPTVGMVCGNRLDGQVDSEALHSRFYLGNKLLAFAHSTLNGVPLKDPLTGLRVIRRDLLRDWKIKSKGFDIEVELNSLIQKKGSKTVEIPIKYRERLGEKKLKMRHGATILRRILIEAFDL
jgi:dolichol-phosphate hexosyltransferase